MKKLGLLVKEISENKIKDNLKNSQSIFIMNYSKISAVDLSALRQSLKNYRARFFVVKNTAARRALKGTDLEQLTKTIDGPCGLVFAKEEPAAISRLIYEFSKSHEQLRFQGGVLKDTIIGRGDFEVLAKLPSQEILRAKAVMTLSSPIKQFVFALNQTLTKFVYCLKQIKNKKGN